MGSWELAALTHGFFSFAPQDPTDGKKKELLKGVEAYEDDKGHQQYRITKVEVRRATRGVQAPRSCWSFRPDFAGPLRSHRACVSSCEDFSRESRPVAWYPRALLAGCVVLGLRAWVAREARGTPCYRPAPRASAAQRPGALLCGLRAAAGAPGLQ